MKIKLISLCIVFICVLTAVSAGVLSVHRSEGRIISPEAQAKIEAYWEQIQEHFAKE